MDDGDLTRREALNMATMWSYVAQASNGRIQTWDDAIAANSQAPSPVPNRTVMTAPVTDTSIVDRSAAFFQSVPWGIVDAFETLDLSERGCRQLARMPAMVFEPGTRQPPTIDVRVARVDDDQGLADFRRALYSSFDLVPWPDASDGLFGPGFGTQPDVEVFVGYDGDEPVGTSVAVTGNDIVGVYLVSVHPSRRGRGIGEALSWAATLAEPSLPAVLQASLQGFPVYQRMGYRTFGHVPFWVPPR